MKKMKRANYECSNYHPGRGGNMYEELVKSLRTDHDKYFARDMEAADAIEELSGKATFKRVDFTEWKGTRYTRYGCPYCHKYVRNDETYCHKCGQALMFPKISFTPYVPGEKQSVIVTWPDEPPKEEI